MNSKDKCPLRPIDLEGTNIKSFRNHQFVVPVEWEYVWSEHNDPRNGRSPDIKRATKFMCICGEIKERKS